MPLLPRRCCYLEVDDVQKHSLSFSQLQTTLYKNKTNRSLPSNVVIRKSSGFSVAATVGINTRHMLTRINNVLPRSMMCSLLYPWKQYLNSGIIQAGATALRSFYRIMSIPLATGVGSSTWNLQIENGYFYVLTHIQEKHIFFRARKNINYLILY